MSAQMRRHICAWPQSRCLPRSSPPAGFRVIFAVGGHQVDEQVIQQLAWQVSSFQDADQHLQIAKRIAASRQLEEHLSVMHSDHEAFIALRSMNNEAAAVIERCGVVSGHHAPPTFPT